MTSCFFFLVTPILFVVGVLSYNWQLYDNSQNMWVHRPCMFLRCSWANKWQYVAFCRCFIASPYTYFLVALPVGLVIIVNSVLFALVIRGLGCGTGSGLQSNQSKGKIARLKVNAAVGCFVLLGKLTHYRPIERRRQSRFCLVILFSSQWHA